MNQLLLQVRILEMVLEACRYTAHDWSNEFVWLVMGDVHFYICGEPAARFGCSMLGGTN